MGQAERQGQTGQTECGWGRKMFFPVKVVRHWKRCPRLLWYHLEFFRSLAGFDLEQPDLIVKL